jgi:NAD+ kinase
MNIAIFGKTVSQENFQYVEIVIDKLYSMSCEISVYRPFFDIVKDKIKFNEGLRIFSSHSDLPSDTNFLFSIGGDGTILDAMTVVRDSGIPIMGINIGRLGFLSSIGKDEVLSAIEMVINGNYGLDSRALIKLLRPKGLFEGLNYALNDVTINRKDSTSLIVIHVYLNDVFLNTYWADGLIIATPTGSTAYSLSSGGPILTPGSENFVITPIAPHNLTVRPIVIPDNSKIRIIAEGRDKQFLTSLDSRTAIIRSKIELVLEKAEFMINLVQLEGQNFYTTIREKLKWGLDIRN